MTTPHHAATLLNRLRTRGVQIWEDQGQLTYRAPQGTISADDLHELKQAKPHLLKLLVEESANEQLIPEPNTRHQPFPLTDVQTAYLLGRNAAFGYGDVACHLYLEINYPQLDPERVRQTWDQLVMRHDMLRATFAQDGSQQVQQQVPPLTITCKQSGPDGALALLDRTREEMGHRVYTPHQWPLFSLNISQLATEKTVLHLSMDFLIADWASIWLLLGEFETLYAHPKKPLAPLTLQFRDYVLAQRSLQDSATWLRDKNWWMARVDTLPLAPQLPLMASSQAPQRSQAHFRRSFLQLDNAQWQRFKQQSAQQGITPTAAVLAAYACVLQQWATDRHFCLNLTVLNRQPLHPQVNQIVGDFTAVSLLEIDHRQPASYGERALALSRQLFDDLDHRLCSGVEVMREMAKRHGREQALMPYVFTSAIGLIATERAGEQMLRGQLDGRGITQTPQVFIDCQAMDNTEGLQVNWDVRDGVFPPEMIDDMFESFRTLLMDMAEQADIWAQPAVIPLPLKQQIRRQNVNATQAPLPAGGLHLPFFLQVERTPEALAVKDHQQQLNYVELQQYALAVAQALRDAGIQPGDLVAITLEKGVWQAVAVLGSMAAAGVWLPLDMTQPYRRRSEILQDAGVKYVLSSSSLEAVCSATLCRINVDQLTSLQLSVQQIQTAQQIQTIQQIDHPDSDAPAYVIYTSGSTGQPKGVIISHRAALNTIQDINRRFAVTERDRVLALAQLGFDLAVYDLFGLLAVGGALIYPQPERITDPSHWITLMDTEQVTLWNSVPALMQMLESALQSTTVTLSHLRLALLSGDWIPLSLPTVLTERLPNLQLVMLGGATEAAIWSNYHLWQGLDPSWSSVPYGVPLANQGFCVLDDQGRDCPVWVSGDLYISGTGLALGYLNDSEKTARQFVHHPNDEQRLYRTGDRARYLPNGALEFLGRADNQLKIKGHRIEPGEIEAALCRFPGVDSACVVPYGDGELRQLLGIVTPNQQFPMITTDYQPAIEAIAQATDALTQHVLPGQFDEASRVLDSAVLGEMHRILSHYGLLQDISARQLARTPVKPAFYWLLRRWQAMVTASGHTQYDSWQNVKQHWPATLASGEFLAYIRQNIDQLIPLLEGHTEAHNILFPQGEFTYVKALYRQNMMAQYLNQAVSTLVKHVFDQHRNGQILRILEIGAGTGGTTQDVLATLTGCEFEYTFTDVAPFFLPEARARFSHQADMRFALLNIDVDIREQGFIPGSYDIVLAAGVLENVRDQQQALTRMQQLTAAHGWLIITEPTREHPWVMVSQAFMMTPPEDEQRQTASYLSSQNWQTLMQQVNDAPVLCLPPARHSLAGQGFHLLAQQIKTNDSPLPLDNILVHLRNDLPDYMIPAQIQPVAALPLTANGKRDRHQMAQWWVDLGADNPTQKDDREHGADALENQLMQLWANALGINQLGPEQDVYDLGADSLIMARMAGKLRKELAGGDYRVDEIPFDTLLRHMLNGPTIRALARAIRSHSLPSQRSNTLPASSHAIHQRPIEPITPNDGRAPGSNGILLPFGGGTDGPLRVVFHSGLGTMDCFRPLLAELDAQQQGPVIGIVIADTAKYCALPPSAVVESLADDYAARLLATGHARFQLIGYCLGGLFALEVARRLVEQGVTIDDLVLISSHPVLFAVEDDLMIESLFIPNLHITLSQAGFGMIDNGMLVKGFMQVLTANQNRIPQGALAALPNEVGVFFNQLTARPIEARFARYVMGLAQHTGQQMPAEMALGLFRVFRQSFHAARYSPSAYTGDIRFLLPDDGSGFAPGMDENTLAFWREISLGEFRVTSIQGNHFSCIEDLQIANVARLVSEGVK